MDREDLARHPEYADNGDRVRKRDEVIALINDWIASHDTTADDLAKFDEYRVPYAPVLDIGQTINHPHHVHSSLPCLHVHPNTLHTNAPPSPLQYFLRLTL